MATLNAIFSIIVSRPLMIDAAYFVRISKFWSAILSTLWHLAYHIGVLEFMHYKKVSLSMQVPSVIWLH